MPETGYREKCLREKGEECADCGATEDIHVHHKDRDRSNDDLDNLIPLCKECHDGRHYGERAERMSGPQNVRNRRAPKRAEDKTIEEAVLDLLREGRVTAPYAADETGYSLQYVRDVLGRLVEHGHARKVYQGLYEFVDDPREEEDD
ncbi:HNH endonuclease [Halogeometricum rufum]|uniref:HNH endonuclease n=1 Tax=Halogeometricum rufum TaxID=553469 RepID=A0A1I6GIE1_9EURY|nr:HNH endonuclease signature motif containing protein [Halogeometricum rufum]SFR41946.1 HNH endonuclease [Halogeometricum rufum]